jgi:hypothetical protein
MSANELKRQIGLINGSTVPLLLIQRVERTRIEPATSGLAKPATKRVESDLRGGLEGASGSSLW